MADFNEAFEKLMIMEGEYSNHGADKGGKTMYGISQRTYPDLDIKSLSKDKAKEIYRKDYWEPLRLDEVHSQLTANNVFEIAVNMGIFWGAKILQEAVNIISWQDIAEDGRVGPVTLAAANLMDEKLLYKTMEGLQFERYHNIVKNEPNQKQFLKGWINKRVFSEGV